MAETERETSSRPGALHPEAELAALRDRIARTDEHMARTLMRATRLAQVISVLGSETELETIVERAAIELGELFFADMALLILDSESGLGIAGHWGVAASDLPDEPFALPDVEKATRLRSVRLGPVEELPIPSWLVPYSPRHVAWARLLVGERSLGLMLLARRGDEPFEASEATELRAIAYRIALAIENGQLHKRMTDQLTQLHRLQQLTAALAGTLDLAGVGRQIAETLVSEADVSSGMVLIERRGKLVVLSSAGAEHDLDIDADGALRGGLSAGWKSFPLAVAGKSVGAVAVTGAPALDSESHQLLLHLVNLAALALDKALLHEQSLEQARHDSLTGLLGHRVFQETLDQLLAAANPFTVLMFDIDDFKQVNDFHGHQTGDQALCLVADALRRGTRSRDSVFRTGGEEFCVLLPGLGADDAFPVAEAMRHMVAAIISTLPNPVTVSAGVASFPLHGRRRDELLTSVDGALYASKRSGKNRTSLAGDETQRVPGPVRREVGLELLQSKDPATVNHSLQVATLAVEIASALGLDDARLDALRTAARLHDIGKIAVPSEILNKPGPLDESEFCIIKTHPGVGAELLELWGLPEPALIVRQHHERIDGAGYPGGLQGDEILLESRILHAADAYVAMILDRPYRNAMEPAAALDELARHSGSQFDIDVVAALVAVEQARPVAAASETIDQILLETPSAALLDV
jgi:diguanylate cyclase (GGDEF)-like protein/putative nucleotidyltransferase with HDIG domain